MTLEQYEAWVNQALPGDRLTYHVGHLAHDRGRFGRRMEWLPEPLDALAKLIYGDWERGLVELTQNRLGPSFGSQQLYRYEYYATRTTKEL